MVTTVGSVEEIIGLVGRELGTSDWLEITQDRINTFADATEDHQWIHCDEERAAAGPFGTTIAHGYLTLSLIIPLMEQILVIENRTAAINYGLNKVRFPAPVPVGSRIRMKATMEDASEVPSGVQVTLNCAIEVEGQERPACVASVVARHLF
jgi:acyl dehydratase